MPGQFGPESGGQHLHNIQSRLDRQGNIIWSVSGADIFVTLKGDSDIVLLEDRIIAIDFENSKYEFDYDGNTLSYTKANV